MYARAWLAVGAGRFILDLNTFDRCITDLSEEGMTNLFRSSKAIAMTVILIMWTTARRCQLHDMVRSDRRRFRKCQSLIVGTARRGGCEQGAHGNSSGISENACRQLMDEVSSIPIE